MPGESTWFSVRCGAWLSIALDDVRVTCADDQQCRLVHLLQVCSGEVGPSAAGDDGQHLLLPGLVEQFLDAVGQRGAIRPQRTKSGRAAAGRVSV